MYQIPYTIHHIHKQQRILEYCCAFSVLGLGNSIKEEEDEKHRERSEKSRGKQTNSNRSFIEMNTAVIIFTQCTYSIILRQSYKFNVCDRFFLFNTFTWKKNTQQSFLDCVLWSFHILKKKKICIYTYIYDHTKSDAPFCVAAKQLYDVFIEIACTRHTHKKRNYSYDHSRKACPAN